MKPERAGKLGPDDSGKESQGGPEYLHVLCLRPADSPAAAGASTKTLLENLGTQLAAAEKYLLENVSYSERRAYKKCSHATRGDVYRYLASKASEVEEKASDRAQHAYEERVDIFNRADTLFHLFLPSDFEGATTSKFWGLVQSAVTVSPGFICLVES